MNFLIDTNIFVYFLTKPEYEKPYQQLKQFIEKNTISLLVPESLLEEWNRKRAQTLQNLEKMFKEADSQSPVGRRTAINAYMGPKIQRAKEIDKWLSNGVTIPLSLAVKGIAVDRLYAGLRPFHSPRSNKSLTDCLIYFSAIEYIIANAITSFVFITNNSDDFGKGTLHPELAQAGVDIKYYNEPGRCFYELKEFLGYSEKSSSTDQTNDYILHVVEPDDNIFHYLYAALVEAQREMEFISTDILPRIAPLRIPHARYAYTYQKNFRLATNNTKVIDFFKEVDFSGSGTFKQGSVYENSTSNLEKLHEIITRLRNNLVFFIYNINGSEQIDIRTKVDKLCPCRHCQFFQLKIDDCLSWFEKHPGAKKITVKDALTASELGLSGRALKYYYALYEKAQQQHQLINTLQYLQYTRWAAQTAEFTSAENVDEVLKKSKVLNIDNAFFDLQNENQYIKELGAVLYRGDIMRRYALELREICDKIRKHYYSQLKGGFSSNNYYVELLSIFLEIEHFIILNGMPFTSFSDFEKLADQYIEAIFMLAGMNQYQDNRLEEFNDTLLRHLLFYGKWESILSYYYRYVKQYISYSSKEANKSITEAIVRLFNNKVLNTTPDTSTLTNFETRLKLQKISSAALTLLSIVNLGEDIIKSCGNALLTLLPTLKVARWTEAQTIKNFIVSRSSILGREWLINAFEVCIKHNLFHEYQELLAAFSDIHESNKVFIDNEDAFTHFSSYFFERCPDCNREHPEWIVEMYAISSPAYHQKIRKLVTEHLQASFDPDLYYSLVMDNIIEAKDFYASFMASVDIPDQKTIKRAQLIQGELVAPKLSHAINLSIAHNMDYPPEFKESMYGITHYYDWILSPETFDYSHFNPFWVQAYKTAPILEKIFSIPAVREAVKAHALKHPDSILSSLYIRYVTL